MNINIAVADAVLVAIVPWKRPAAADLATQFHVGLRRRDPFELEAVVLILAAEERLVHERSIEEVPGVLVLIVEISDRGEKAAEFRRQPVRRGGVKAVRFFDLDRVLWREREGQIAVEL